MKLFCLLCLSLFISIFEFVSVTDSWTFSISVIKIYLSSNMDHCLVSCLFSSNFFFIKTLFNSFKFCWSSSICFPCSLMAPTNLSVVLIISLSSAKSSDFSIVFFDSFEFSSANSFRQSSFTCKQLSQMKTKKFGYNLWFTTVLFRTSRSQHNFLFKKLWRMFPEVLTSIFYDWK